MSSPPSKMTGDQIVALTRQHTLYEWSAQSKVDPIPVARAEGIYFYTPEGKRFIDFNSQLMSVNVGHGEQRIIRAITEQLNTLAFANPFMATEPRARLGAKLAELASSHPSVGAVRSIGLFGIVELVRDRKTLEPMAPFNGTSEEMAALGRFFRQQGLYTMVRWNSFYTNPPLTITEAQLREAFDIIDRGLTLTDKAVRG